MKGNPYHYTAILGRCKPFHVFNIIESSIQVHQKGVNTLPHWNSHISFTTSLQVSEESYWKLNLMSCEYDWHQISWINIKIKKVKMMNIKWLPKLNQKHLIMFSMADSNRSALLGGFWRNSSSTTVSKPAFLRKLALWITVNPSSITFSRRVGGGCKPQYRFLGTWNIPKKFNIH